MNQMRRMVLWLLGWISTCTTDWSWSIAHCFCKACWRRSAFKLVDIHELSMCSCVCLCRQMLALSDWVASGPLNPQTAPFRVAPMFTCSRCLERVCFMHHSASLIGKNFDSCLENDSKTSKGKCAPCLTFHLNLEVQPAECWSGG